MLNAFAGTGRRWWTTALSMGLALTCVAALPADGQDAAPAPGLADDAEAMVQLNYYTTEPEATVVFDLGPDAAKQGYKLNAQLGGNTFSQSDIDPSGVTRLSLPIAELDEGEHEVKLSIDKGSKTVWETTDTLRKIAPAPSGIRVVQSDRHRRIMLIDGEPYFAIGVFGVYFDSLQEVADAGFNVTLRWKGETKLNRWDREKPWDSKYNQEAVDNYLDAIHKAGMYAVETPVKMAEEGLYHRFRDIPEEYAKGPYWDDKYPIHNQEITPGVVKNARDHPAVIGYYSYDEPDNFYPTTPEHPKHLLMQTGVEEWYRIVRDLDPYHPVMALFAVGLSKVEDWNAWDVAMRDYYIYRDKHMSEVYVTAEDSVRIAHKMRTPFIYTPLFEKSSGRPVPLSGPEQRSQTYLSLAADVKGLFYWDWPAAYAPNWEMLKQMAGEVQQLTPVLLEKAPRQTVNYRSKDHEKSVKVLVKNHEGKTYLIAVSAEPAPVNFEIKLPDGYSSAAKVWFEDREVELSNGTLRDEFEPYGRHVYELSDQPWPDGEALTLSLKVGSEPKLVDPEFKLSRDNLLTNTSFEYDYARLPGWPVDWHPNDSVMEAGQVGVDDGRWTPTGREAHEGKRSLQLIKEKPGRADSNDFYNFMSVPTARQSVRYPRGGDYTLSLYAKADRPTELIATHGWQQLEPVKVGKDWQRFEWTFNQGSAGNGFIGIAPVERGTVWVDAVQLEMGKKATPYNATGPRNRD